jgi:hypothetical protein
MSRPRSHPTKPPWHNPPAGRPTRARASTTSTTPRGRPPYAVHPTTTGTEPICHHRLHFTDGSYDWQYTDMVISGSYVCEGLQIRALDPEPIRGRLDPETGHIFWDGLEYLPVAGP